MRCVGMPTYQISVVNDHFRANNDEDHADADTAHKQAIRSALAIGVEEILAGKKFFGAEVVVATGGESQRFLISVGASPLL